MGFTPHDLVYTELSPHRRLQRAATRATGEAAAVGVLCSSRWNCTAASRQARSVDGSRTCQLPQPASRPHNCCKQATHCISQGQQTAPPKRRESARVLCPLEQAPAVKDAREGARAVYTTVHNRQLATLLAEPYRGTHYLLRWTRSRRLLSILWRTATWLGYMLKRPTKHAMIPFSCGASLERLRLRTALANLAARRHKRCLMI